MLSIGVKTSKPNSPRRFLPEKACDEIVGQVLQSIRRDSPRDGTFDT